MSKRYEQIISIFIHREARMDYAGRPIIGRTRANVHGWSSQLGAASSFWCLELYAKPTKSQKRNPGSAPGSTQPQAAGPAHVAFSGPQEK